MDPVVPPPRQRCRDERWPPASSPPASRITRTRHQSRPVPPVDMQFQNKKYLVSYGVYVDSSRPATKDIRGSSRSTTNHVMGVGCRYVRTYCIFVGAGHGRWSVPSLNRHYNKKVLYRYISWLARARPRAKSIARTSFFRHPTIQRKKK